MTRRRSGLTIFAVPRFDMTTLGGRWDARSIGAASRRLVEVRRVVGDDAIRAVDRDEELIGGHSIANSLRHAV